MRPNGRHRRHGERHRIRRIGWLRAAVLGANDGIVSTASLCVGVALAAASKSDILIAAVAGLVAGAMSMAAGEYVSVASQADTERADLAREREELRTDPAGEEMELAGIYVKRGLDRDLANRVAHALMAHDALSAHARDELGISAVLAARPVQAAMASALSFSVGAVLPVAAVLLAPVRLIPAAVALLSLICLGLLGALGAWAGGSNMPRAVVRVTFWGVMAMALTAGIGLAIGKAV
ncbi:MAG: VIT family protein [Alphaproteobacteria bacterium]